MPQPSSAVQASSSAAATAAVQGEHRLAGISKTAKAQFKGTFAESAFRNTNAAPVNRTARVESPVQDKGENRLPPAPFEGEC